LVQPP